MVGRCVAIGQALPHGVASPACSKDRGCVTHRGQLTPFAEIRGLTRHFDLGRNQIVHAVDDMSLDIAPREIVGIVGQKRLRRVAKVLRLHTDIGSWPFRERVAEWLEPVCLDARRTSRYPHEFSGGQRKPIEIARVLSMEPEFVVCDEPISPPDVSVHVQLVNLLGELKESLGLDAVHRARPLDGAVHPGSGRNVSRVSDRVGGPANHVSFHPKHSHTEILVGYNPEPEPRSGGIGRPRRFRRDPAPSNGRGVTVCESVAEGDGALSGRDAGVPDGGDVRESERIVACHWC